MVEIGPGPGGITRAILEKPIERLDVVEIDERFIPPLVILQGASNQRMHIHQANILKTDIGKIWEEANAPKVSWYDDDALVPFHIIGNLPFNIASPLIIKFLANISAREGAWAFGRVPLTLSFQAEVARRIVSSIDCDTRSRISVMSQFFTVPKLLFQIPGNC